MEETVTEEIKTEEIKTEEILRTDVPPEENHSRRKTASRRGLVGLTAGFAAGFAACLAVLAIVVYVAHLGRFIPEADYQFYNDLSDQFGKYYVIMEMIGDDPLVEKTPEMISDDSIKKLISDLNDPYAEYFTAKEYEAFRKRYEGNYVGIGILVGQTDEGLRIESVQEDGPAHEAGIMSGDIIVRVDGKEPADLDDAVSMMTSGEEGSLVTVTVSRDGKEIDFEVTRKAIGLDSVGYAVSEDDPDVGYIRISLFSADTCDEFKNAVKDLQGKGCSKFILDLRQNGGGLTDVSVDIADYLLPSCRIMSEVTKDGKEKVFNSKKSSADLDMVVLVDENTASASEILTAAIKENGAGTIIGTRTYGKGVTQISREFKDGSAVKMTVTEYLTPQGNHVQDKGIEPDIEATESDILDKALEELSEK